MSFPDNLVIMAGFHAGGTLSVVPGSPRALCCPQYLVVESQAGWRVRPHTQEMQRPQWVKDVPQRFA